MISLHDPGHYLVIVSVRYEILCVIILREYINYKYNTYIR